MNSAIPKVLENASAGKPRKSASEALLTKMPKSEFTFGSTSKFSIFLKMAKSKKKSYKKSPKTAHKVERTGLRPPRSDQKVPRLGLRPATKNLRFQFWEKRKNWQNPQMSERPWPCSAQPETQDAGICISAKQLTHGSNATMAPSLEGHHGRREVTIHSAPTRTPGLQTEGSHSTHGRVAI